MANEVIKAKKFNIDGVDYELEGSGGGYIDAQLVGIKKRGEESEKVLLLSNDMQDGDEVRLFRYVNRVGRICKDSTQGKGYKRRKRGWREVAISGSTYLSSISAVESDIIKVAGGKEVQSYDVVLSYGDETGSPLNYANERNRGIEEEEWENGECPVDLNSKCALVIYRDGVRISDYLRFRVAWSGNANDGDGAYVFSNWY